MTDRFHSVSMTYLYRVALLLLLLLLLTALVPVYGAAIVLDRPRIELQHAAEVFVDTTRQMTLDEIRTDAVDRQFKPFSEAPGEYSGATVWLKLTLESVDVQPKEWWLEISPSSIEHLTLYGIGEHGDIHAAVSGRKVPYDVQVANYRYPFFQLKLNSLQKKTIYLQVNSDVYSIKRLLLSEPATFVGFATLDMLLWGMYLGIFSLLFIASLWFEQAIRDGVYAAFGLYALSCVLMTLSSTGLFYQYQRWIPLDAGAIPFVSWTILLGMYSCVNFFFRFVGMQTIKPRFTFYYLNAIKVFCILIGIAVLIPEISVAARAVIGIVMNYVVAPITLIVLLRPAFKSSSEVRNAFLISGILLPLSSVFQYAIHKGYITLPNASTYASGVASLVFSLVIYYSVSKRYQGMREAKEAVHTEILAIMHQSERELDKQVEDKKRELVEAMSIVTQALAQERKIYEEQKKFIERVSTELHAPISVIDATTQNLITQAQGMSPKMQMRLEKIQQSTDRLSSLIKDYLSSNRLNILSRNVMRSLLPLSDCFDDAIEAARPLAERHVFVVDKDRLPEYVYADPDLLRLVLRTLVDNAVKYTLPGTTITLQAQLVPDGWHIDVVDSGEGIAPDEQPFVFDRYYRGRTATKRTGTGLGLPLARYLVEMQGGTLTLLDTQDSGCAFRIFLPLAQEMVAPNRLNAA